jgi:MFS superfamily sulfate permease-like transporter
MMKKITAPSVGDLLGGFAGAAVALPQAIGLGVLLQSRDGLSSMLGIPEKAPRKEK